jgi:hypothetical protein
MEILICHFQWDSAVEDSLHICFKGIAMLSSAVLILTFYSQRSAQVLMHKPKTRKMIGFISKYLLKTIAQRHSSTKFFSHYKLVSLLIIEYLGKKLG